MSSSGATLARLRARMSLWVVTLGTLQPRGVVSVRGWDCSVAQLQLGVSCCWLFLWLPCRLLPVAVGQILTYPDPAALSHLQPCLRAPLCPLLSWIPSVFQPYHVRNYLLCLRCQ